MRALDQVSLFRSPSNCGRDRVVLIAGCVVLAAAGIVFAVVFIIVAFACAEDPLNDLVEKYGRMYGIVG